MNITLKIDGLTYFGTYEEYLNFEKIGCGWPDEWVIGILEHYDLENWL